MAAWTKADARFFFASAETSDGTCYRLTVERMEGEGDTWEWLAWRAKAPGGHAYHGYAHSALHAMKAAERVLNNRRELAPLCSEPQR